MLRRLPPCRDGPKSLQVCCECPAVELPEVAMASASVHGARGKGFLRRQKTLPKTHKVVRSLLWIWGFAHARACMYIYILIDGWIEWFIHFLIHPYAVHVSLNPHKASRALTGRIRTKRRNGCNFDVAFPITFSSCLPHVFPPSADPPRIQAYWFSAASLFFSYFHFYALSHLQLSGFVTFLRSKWFVILVFCHFLYFGLAYRYHDLYLGVYLWFY